MKAAARAVLAARMAELTAAARADDHASYHEPMIARTRQVEGLRSESRFGDLGMTIDEPVGFGGTGLAPNPAEALLAALGASLEVTLRCYAVYLGYDVDAIRVDLDGALDNRGFFDTRSDVRAGYDRIEARIFVTGTATADQIAALANRLDRCCPLLDIIRNPTPVSVSVIQEGIEA